MLKASCCNFLGVFFPFIGENLFWGCLLPQLCSNSFSNGATRPLRRIPKSVDAGICGKGSYGDPTWAASRKVDASEWQRLVSVKQALSPQKVSWVRIEVIDSDLNRNTPARFPWGRSSRWHCFKKCPIFSLGLPCYNTST